MTFKDFVHKDNSKNEKTTNTKFCQFLCSTVLNNVDIHLRDGPLESDISIVNLHPSRGTHWVYYMNAIYFGNYGCVCPINYLNF